MIYTENRTNQKSSVEQMPMIAHLIMLCFIGTLFLCGATTANKDSEFRTIQCASSIA
jgi:hypothetical protein